MSLTGSAQEKDSTKDEMHQLRRELNRMMGEKQASMMHAMRDGARVHEEQRPIGIRQC